MKAPETIFLHGYSFDDEPCKNWTLEPIKRGMRGYAVQNETYIRKDALLEKIDDAVAHLSDGSLTGYYESLAYKDIRELIESM